MRQRSEQITRGHRGLIAWEKGIELAVKVLDLCDAIPLRRGAGVVPQIRRSVISVPSNIAEGYDRPKGEYASSVRIARGSLREVDTQLEIMLRRGTARTETILALLCDADELGRITSGLADSIAAGGNSR